MLKYAEGKTIKNIITGEEIYPGEFEYDWQEFVLKRIDAINEESFDEIDVLLEQIGDNNLADNIRECIINKILRVRFINYNRNFFYEIKKTLTF